MTQWLASVGVMLLPDRLRELWASVDAGTTTFEVASAEQARGIDELAAEWRAALLQGDGDLRTSLVREVAAYHGLADLAEIERRLGTAVQRLREQWADGVDRTERASVERFYESSATIDELMDWHSLRDDTSPLAYVLALHVAREHGVERCLDFGSGVGSGALLFAANRIDVTLADVSTRLLDFCRWRFRSRDRQATFVDLKREALPAAHFDLVLAMDVFEHLVDPIEAADAIHAALRPGGWLYARIHAEEDVERPQHIARDFGPTFVRLEQLGLVEVWRDGWLWGHQLFQKRP